MSYGICKLNTVYRIGCYDGGKYVARSRTEGTYLMFKNDLRCLPCFKYVVFKTVSTFKPRNNNLLWPHIRKLTAQHEKFVFIHIRMVLSPGKNTSLGQIRR